MKKVEAEAFAGLSFRAVVIPEGCTEIGEKAFKGCASLVYIRIPSTVKDLPDSAFEGCDENLMVEMVGK